MKSIKKTTLIQSSILTATLFLNSGCFFGYLGDQVEPTTQAKPKIAVSRTIPESIQQPVPAVKVSKTIPEPIQQPVVQVTKTIPEYIQPVEISENISTSLPVRRVMTPPIASKTMPNSYSRHSSTSQSITTDNQIVAECSDDINAVSGCEKELISETQLKTPIKTNSGGEIHKLRTLKGKAITVEERSNGFIFPEYGNKIVILEMFGKNCAHCIKEIPILNRLRNKYRSNVEVIAIQVEDKMSPSEAKRLIRRHNIRYPIVAGDTATNLQYNIQTTYGWTGILPFTMIIKDGVTEMSHKGEVSYRELNQNIRSLLH